MLIALAFSCATTTTPEPATAAPEPASPVEQTEQTEQTPTESWVELHQTAIGPVTAIFHGEAVPPGIQPAFGVRQIVFRLADGTELPFTPSGTVEFNDWTLEPGSPDGAHVLLVQDHYGPYHVVAIDSLSAYLAGTAPPDHILHQAQAPDVGAWVHEGGRWTSTTDLAYEAGLSTMETFTYSLASTED